VPVLICKLCDNRVRYDFGDRWPECHGQPMARDICTAMINDAECGLPKLNPIHHQSRIGHFHPFRTDRDR
jgi:hypothetical protein